MTETHNSPAPTKWSDLDPYLKPIHLPNGKEIKAIVEKIEFQTVHPKPGLKEIKPVMYFQGKKKALILNATNQKFLRDNFGDDITGSYGKEILLEPKTKTIAGRQLDTIVLAMPWIDASKP